MSETNYELIASKFKLNGNFVSAERYGSGHINETMLVVTSNAEGKQTRYILQKISKRMTERVDLLMRNIKLVTDLNRNEVIKAGGNPDRESLTLIDTVDGNYFYFDGNDYFRTYIFIENSVSYQLVEKPKHFLECGRAFGKFQRMVSKCDVSELFEALVNFHNTAVRYNNLEKAIVEDKLSRAVNVKDEIEFALKRKDITGTIVNLLRSGTMPTKVTHNDTKLNNILFDDKTEKGLVVIDLDTIMPGSICYDFGDAIRFGCNPCAEDEKDLTKVVFNIELFKQFAIGFVGALKGTITQVELDNLALGAILMTYECGIRFLTDYLEGDVYFRTHYEGQNLDRCRTQFKLVSDMETALPQMKKIINEVAKA